MNKILFIPVFLLCTQLGKAQQKYLLQSPDRSLAVRVWEEGGKAYYDVVRNGKEVMFASSLGVKTEEADYTSGIKMEGRRPVTIEKKEYTMLQGKRRNISTQLTRQSITLVSSNGKQAVVSFAVGNDGVAFRYILPVQKNVAPAPVNRESTSFHFRPGTTAWMQPMSDAKSGWERTNPSYEEYYQSAIPAGTPAPTAAGWVMPALFNYGESWMLVTEAGVGTHYVGSRLQQQSEGEEYRIGFPGAKEVFTGKGLLPVATTGNFTTPWRIIAVGSLATIMESTLGTDLAEPVIKPDTTWMKPGKASWSWALMKDNSVNYEVQKNFIDYAADMHWEYCLVDVNWDTQIGYDKIQELTNYANSKNVGLILWYNSSGDWNGTQYHPKSKLLTKEARRAEFEKIAKMGVKGVKVDFFGGDGQSMIAYYIDILKDAADFKLLVNFHGATYPRGWQRQYPHLMTMEAVKGEEFITFDQKNADQQPAVCATYPFIRNVFDPMDFTPMVLDSIPGIHRRTTASFELALPVVFLSGIQHMAETPVGMAKAPAYVKSFLQQLPSSWDNTRFLDGYPAKYAVVARQAAGKWYIAGINGEESGHKVTLDLSFLPGATRLSIISDGEDALRFGRQEVLLGTDGKLTLNMKPGGGFVITTE